MYLMAIFKENVRLDKDKERERAAKEKTMMRVEAPLERVKDLVARALARSGVDGPAVSSPEEK